MTQEESPMVRFAATLAIVGLLQASTRASAATFFFEAVPAPQSQNNANCPPPCFNVRIFFEDPSRSLQLQSIAFEITVLGDFSTVATLPVPPATSNQVASGNFLDENFLLFPWNLSS